MSKGKPTHKGHYHCNSVYILSRNINVLNMSKGKPTWNVIMMS